MTLGWLSAEEAVELYVAADGTIVEFAKANHVLRAVLGAVILPVPTVNASPLMLSETGAFPKKPLGERTLYVVGIAARAAM